MIVYCVRHGETSWNRRKKLQGQHDTKLTPKGIAQAKLAGEGMKDIPFDYIVSSPLTRARLTAEAIRGDRDLEIHYDDLLKEIDFGPDNGRVFGKVMNDPHFVRYQRFFREPHLYRPRKGAESLQHLIDRTDRFFKESILPLEGQYETVLVVGHTTWFHAWLTHLNKRPLSDFWNSSFGKNCDSCIFEVKDGEIRMTCESKMFWDEADLNV